MTRTKKKILIASVALMVCISVCMMLVTALGIFTCAFHFNRDFQSKVVHLGTDLLWMRARPAVTGEVVESEQFLPPPDDVVLMVGGRAIFLTEEDKTALYQCFTEDMNGLHHVGFWKMRFSSVRFWEYLVEEDVSVEFRYKTPQSFVGNIAGSHGGKSPIPDLIPDEEWGTYLIPHFTYDAVTFCFKSKASPIVVAHYNGEYYGLNNTFVYLNTGIAEARMWTKAIEIANR